MPGSLTAKEKLWNGSFQVFKWPKKRVLIE